MRTQWLFLGLFVAAAGTAWAQTDEGFESDESGFGGEVEGGRVGLEPPGAERAEDPVLGEVHQVERGDTLWDLSSRYLNTPWYWPKVWSYNPQLTNPHWIFPGNEVRFYPGDANLPTAVDVSSDDLDIGDELVIPGQVDDDELVKTVGAINAAESVGRSVWTAYSGFLDPASDRLTGRIDDAFSPRYQLDDFDRVYIELRAPAETGERLAIYRRERKVNHPVTGASLGYMVSLIGQVEITENTPDVTVATITDSYRPAQRGDYVGPLPEYWGRRVQPTPNQVEAEGYIVETLADLITLVGEYQMVLLDRGRADGLQVGNILTVYARGDAYTGRTQNLPLERVGRVMVLDLQETGSTGVVLSSARALDVGDRIKAQIP
jgi:hypothetical protein